MFCWWPIPYDLEDKRFLEPDIVSLQCLRMQWRVYWAEWRYSSGIFNGAKYTNYRMAAIRWIGCEIVHTDIFVENTPVLTLDSVDGQSAPYLFPVQPN